MAARISGVTIPAEKQVWVALTYVYGIGPKSAHDILTKAKVESTTRVKDLTDAEISRIQEVINADYIVEGEAPAHSQRQHQAAEGHQVVPRPAPRFRICRPAASAPRPTPAPAAARK